MKFLFKNGFYVSALLSMLTFAVYPTLAQALGMGAAETQSSIGENMRVRVSLFNVQNPDAIEIELTNLDGQTSLLKNLNAELDRSNSQLTVLIESEQAVNEPFFSFSLSVTDGAATVSRDFNVLFDLPRGVSSNFDVASRYDVQDLDVVPTTPLANSDNRSNAEIMGPYDWAQAGSIPEKFGPVLDGQSLWRVARRINKAMGVTQEQMMWALYEANRQAFSSSSVESLRAGEVLTIPSESQVRATSFTAARQQLKDLSTAPVATTAPSNSPALTQESSLVDVQTSTEEAPIDEFVDSSSASEPAFQLTGLEGVGGVSANSDDQQSSAIIQSLAETVGNLSQELIRKDEQISLLEGQVEELKNFIRDEGNIPPVASLDEITATETQIESQPEDDFEPPAEIEAQAELQSDTDTVVEPDPNEIITSAETVEQSEQVDTVAAPVVPQAEQKQNYNLWLLIVGLVASVLLTLFLLRKRLASLFKSLHIGDGNDHLDFDHANEPIINAGRSQQSDSPRDYSTIQAVQRNLDGNELAEGISYIDLADDKETSEEELDLGPEKVAVSSQPVSDDIEYDDGSYEANEILAIDEEASELEAFAEVDDEDLTFDERFTRLIEEKDYSFARELLDFARYNEINDDRYHCERLRLLKAMGNEDGFYEYYYEIEAKIPEFPPKLQTEISQFVVQLAQAG